MNEWVVKPLSELAVLFKDSWKVGDEEAPYIALEHIEEGKLRLIGFDHSSIVTSNKYRFSEQNFLFGKLRPYFRKVVKPQFSGICSTDIWVVGAADGIDLTFLFYLFANQAFIDLAYSGSSGTKMPRADWNFLKVTEWLVPVDIEEQRAIAGILSTLDDKIDLLHRQNETLDALAQTLFRQWFVEKAEDGWDEGVLSDYCDVIDCLHAKKPEEIEAQENSKYLLQVFNIADGGIVDLSKKYYVSDEDYKEWVRRIELSGGDLFISKTGRVGAIAQIPYYMKAGIGRNLVAIHPKNPFTPEFLKDLMLSNWMNRKIRENTSDGTILRSLHVKSISALPVIFPGKALIAQYSEIIRPIHRKIMENLRNRETLEKLRDTLLPKLMRGEARVQL